MGFHLFLFNSTFSKKGNKQELQKFLTTFYSEQEAIEKLVEKKQNNKTTVWIRQRIVGIVEDSVHVASIFPTKSTSESLYKQDKPVERNLLMCLQRPVTLHIVQILEQ